MTSPKKDRPPRWATRQGAMEYAKVGSTRLNEWMQARQIIAKKNGVRVIIDLNSIDDMLASLPDAAD
jgi:hypothetical protein